MKKTVDTLTTAELKAEVARREAEEEKAQEAHLWSLVRHLVRDEMVVLRRLLDRYIKESYNADDE